MQTAARKSLFLTDCTSIELLTGLPKAVRQSEFYQQSIKALIKGTYRKESFIELGRRLVALADRAYTFRRMDVVEQASSIILNLPLPRDYRSIARYYQAYCIKRSGQFDKALPLFERVAEEAPPAYKARAIVALGSVAFDSGDYKSALPLYIEAGKAATRPQHFDPLAAFYTGHMLSVLKSIDGDHSGALADLEKLFPLISAIRRFYPPMYHNYLNSVAVEMIEVGRLEEASNISNIVLATPYANAYPEWRETGVVLLVRGYRTPRSTLYFADSKPKNLFHLPETECGDSQDSPVAPQPECKVSQPPARILNYVDWKRKMVKEPNGDQTPNITPQEIERMSEQDMIVKIFRLSSQEGLTWEQLRDILEHVLKVTKGE